MDDGQRATRRTFVKALAGVFATTAAAVPLPVLAQMSSDPREGPAPAGFRERFVVRAGHRIYVRDYPGAGPAFVMVHGFPDNCRIYGDLAPLLSAAGRRVIAFDFLGFGSSDKPKGFRYDFSQQVADLAAVVSELDDGPVVPVAHDAGGPAVINFALDNSRTVSSVTLLNCYYASSPVLRFPEFIELCSNPELKALSRAMMTDPKLAAWLLHFQQGRFEVDATPALRARFDGVLQPIINDNFARSPSSVPAFLGMTADARANLAYNTARLASVRSFDRPVKLIWGVQDPYLNKAVADDLTSHFPRATFTGLAANHWPQIDTPDLVARAMLARD